MQWMKVKSVYNHADFRFIDSRVITELEKFNVLRSNEKIKKISSDISFKRSMRIEVVKTNQKEYIGINTLYSENLCSAEWTDTKEYIGIPYLILEQEFQKK